MIALRDKCVFWTWQMLKSVKNVEQVNGFDWAEHWLQY